jgi:hypothetical protein
MIQAKALAAHARGVARDKHEFNWHSYAAIAVWQHTWDLCEAEDLRARADQAAQQLEPIAAAHQAIA